MLKDTIRDRLGFAFFAFAAIVAGVAAWQSPSILAWLYAFHNLLLAWFYARREPAKKYDRVGLWLGMIAALLPTTVHNGPSPVFALARFVRLWTDFMVVGDFGKAVRDRAGRSRYYQPGTLSFNTTSDVSW